MDIRFRWKATSYICITPRLLATLPATSTGRDNNNNDNIRPDGVKGTLYANGESTGQTLEFNADNDWTQTWQDVASLL